MKIFASELNTNYKTYTFGYCVYATLEHGDSLAKAYTQGFLPYSGSKDAAGILYMARSARLRLKEFVLTSENRRIAKKFGGQFEREVIPLTKFEADKDFYNFCLAYFAERHGERAMSRERLEFIMQSPFITHVVRYTAQGEPVGYVLLMREGNTEHYWFSFYDPARVHQSLGLWLMLDCVREAKEAGLEHYYLGTVYGEKALYKTNFEPLEWWSGETWSSDIKLLKKKGRSDSTRTTSQTDEWKTDQTLF